MKLVSYQSGAPGKRVSPGRPGWKVSLILSAAFSLGLSGCLFDRVLEVKNQACDFEGNFDLQFTDNPAIDLRTPVLLDSDVEWIVGAQPTARTATEEGIRLSYVIEEDKPVPNPEYDVEIHFDFAQIDEKYRLSKVHLDPDISLFFNPVVLDEETLRTAAKDVCEFGIWPGSTSIEMDIGEDTIDWLPSKSEILQQVGPPHALTGPQGGWTYGYRLKGAGERGKAKVTVWFDDGQKPVRLESRYSRYHFNADFDARIVSMNLKL